MAQLLADAAAPGAARKHYLEGTDALKHAIVVDGKFPPDGANTGSMRRDVLGKYRHLPKLSETIKKAAAEMARQGLLTEHGRAKRNGRPTYLCKRARWENMSEEAKAEATRLMVPRRIFD